MTTVIEVYPSTLPGEPLERHCIVSGPLEPSTLEKWLEQNCTSYVPGLHQPITASVAGVVVPPARWGQLGFLPGMVIQLYPVPRDPVTATLWIVGGMLVGAALVSMMKPKISTQGAGSQGQQLSGAGLQANTPKLNAVIPEIAGRRRVYPDYLCQPRKYFVSPNTQATDVMLCIGRGEFLIDPVEIRIGETALDVLGNLVNYAIYTPGATVSSHHAHRNWYNAPEVGASTSSAGLRLTAGVAGTARATASNYRIDASSITIPTGAGVAPQDWEVGSVVSIIAKTRTITIMDWGSYPMYNRNLVRGSFGDLGLAVGDQILIWGTANDDGRYQVATLDSTVNEPGNASTIIGTVVAGLAYSTTPATFVVSSYTLTLDQDYASASALVAAINSQMAGVVASQVAGIVTITEASPYSGTAITLTGDFAPVLGVSPTTTTGTSTTYQDELTLDKWVADTYYDVDVGPVQTEGWQLATSMNVGTHAYVEVQKPRVKTISSTGVFGAITATTYGPTEYQITAIITGEIPGGTGVVGWTFQRLNPDGSDDAAWIGFQRDDVTPRVSIELDGSQVVGGWLGPFRATPASEGTSLLEFDLFAPSGIGYVDGGNVQRRDKYIQVQWKSGTSGWASTTYSIGGSSRDQLGYTFAVDVPNGSTAVDVRMRRIGAEDTSLEALDRIEWYGLRSLLFSPSSYGGVTTMALTLQGSNQISSQSENQVNLIVTRKLGGVATRAIDAWVRHICTDIGYTSGDINESELSSLAAVWASRDDWFDHIVNEPTTVRDALAIALRAGFAELTIDRGTIRPVRDQVRNDFEHLYTPQNMVSALRYQFTAYDPDEYDGVDVEYTSSTTWQQETVQCRLPGDIGLRVDKITLDGITDRTHAWRIGMRARRAHKYRRKTYTFSTEWDALNSRYLSYCALSDDVPGYGQSAILIAWSASAGNTSLTVSEPLTWVSGASHVAALRRPDGTLCGPHAATRISDSQIQIDTAALDFAPVLPGSSIEPTHVLFGTSTTWSYPVLITDISPSGDTVDVTAINYDARIYADDDSTPS